jgi:hypothetical protein
MPATRLTSSGFNPAKARDLKRQALALLEWTMAEMSPDDDHPLSLQCGFEREGHFIPPMIPDPELTPANWENALSDSLHRLIAAMQADLQDEDCLLKIYHDTWGTFMLEGVTKRAGLLEAADGIKRISASMLKTAERLHVQYRGFGPVPADDIVEYLNATAETDFGVPGVRNSAAYAEKVFVDYSGEVFDTPQGKILAGRGQHCNVSIWLGDTNLFACPPGDKAGPALVNHGASQALEWLPHMMLPCRRGNYHRVQSDAVVVPRSFSISGLNSGKSGQMMRYVSDGLRRIPGKNGAEDEIIWKPSRFRLEFRQAAAEADPYDVALASAVPLVKACDDMFMQENGKVRLDEHGNPRLRFERDFPADYNAPVPTTHAEAAKGFAAWPNPYFTYLDELAQRRVNAAADAAERQEATALLGIGSRLYDSYCQEYRLKNRRPGAGVGQASGR